MREIWILFRQGWRAISKTGRRVLAVYGTVLTLLSLIDALALYVLSKSILANSAAEVTVDGMGQSLALVIVLFLIRSVLATAVSYWGVKHFANQEVLLGSNRFSFISNLNWEERQSITAVELYGSVDRGPNALVQGVLLPMVTVFTEFVGALVILLAILFINPLTAIVALLYFVSIALLQHRVLSVASQSAGAKVVAATISTHQKLSDVNGIAKLLAISPSKSFHEALELTRSDLAHARASAAFLGLLPRYFMESVLALGFLVVAISSFLIEGPGAAAVSITVFAAAGFRLLPIVNRIQGLTLLMFSTEPTAKLTFEGQIPASADSSNPFQETHIEAIDDGVLLKLENVSYRYPNTSRNVLEGVELQFKAGLQYAIVGPSGAGKTTLIDICLGLLQPQEGFVMWNQNYKSINLSYVPQETKLISGSLYQNVALEWNDSHISKALVGTAIQDAQLDSIISSDFNFDTMLGDGGSSISGGQKQRVGLARALYRQPSFLVLDEATSSLDSETEESVMKSIRGLRGNATVLIVAHRLSTVKNVDYLIYVDEGKVQGVGTFDELRLTVPRFSLQVDLGTLEFIE